MLLLIAAVHACIELRRNFPRGSDIREGLKTWHFMLGLSVLVLVFARVALRFGSAVPQIEPDPPKWQSSFARRDAPGLVCVDDWHVAFGVADAWG